MDQDFSRSPDAAADAAPFQFHDSAAPAASTPTMKRGHGQLLGHMPDLVDPLGTGELDSAEADTRRLRHDGWTPERMRLFHESFAERGTVTDACRAAGMSARAAYNLRDRDPLFAAGWEAAALKARARLADEAYARALNGVVDRIYRDGAIIAERHRYDNRLTMAVLARLDARVDRAEAQGDPTLALAARWDDYLAALGEGRREDALALLAPAAPAAAAQDAKDRELRELHPAEAGEADADHHVIWQQDGDWWTDYPPPAEFDGIEHGDYGDFRYRRTLSPREMADIKAQEAEDRAEAEAQRDAAFGFAGGTLTDDDDDDLS